MCLKVSFSKVIFRSLNLFATNAETAACGNGTPIAAYEEDQSDILSPALSWEEFSSVCTPVFKNADIL